MKRGYIIILAAAILLSMLSGCGGTTSSQSSVSVTSLGSESAEDNNFNPTGYPIVKEKITLTGFGNQNVTHGDWSDIYCFNEYEKISNIHIDWTTAPNQGYDEKKNLLLASGEYPDIFYRANLSVSDQLTYGGLGLLSDLSDLIEEYAPNLMERAAEDPNILRSIRMPDGAIYSLPHIEPLNLPTASQKNWINKVWLDNLGLSVPDTTEELHQVLKAFKEQDANGNGDPNDEIPYSCRQKGTSLFNSTYGSFGMGDLGSPGFNVYIDRGEDGKIRFMATADNFKKQLEWMHQLYTEGLLDPEMFTQEITDFTAKGEQNLIGAFFSNDNPQVISGTYSKDYVTTRALTGPDGDKQFSNFNNPVASGTFAVSSTNPYPEESVRWIDYFYGHDGNVLIRLGEEGVTYHVGSDGTYTLDDSIVNNKEGLTVPQALGKTAIGSAGGGCPEYVFRDVELSRLPEGSEEWMEYVSQDYDPEKVNVMPFLFTKEEQEQLNGLATDIKGYVDEMRVAFVTGQRPLSEWDDYVAAINQMGVDRYVALYQTSYDRFMAD